MGGDRYLLTQEESEALCALVQHGTVAQAAAALQRPVATLDGQIDRVRKKTGCHRNVQLGAYAGLHRLVDETQLPSP